MEIRGLGIVYVPDLFGPEAVRDECAVDLCCRLEHWREGAEYERIGLERPTRADRSASPVPGAAAAGRARAATWRPLVEVAARDHRLRARRA